MSKDTITLKLTGDIPLEEFSLAVQAFSDLVNSLTSEITGEKQIAWNIAGLEFGSAIATIRGFNEETETVEKVVEAYAVVGDSLQRKAPIPYSDKVSESARVLTSVIKGKITGIQFITTDRQSLIIEPYMYELEPKKMGAIGSITGTVETLIRKESKFTLYDAIFDRAVTCFFDKDNEEIIRNIWGKRVTVTGKVIRDQSTGRPNEVREVRTIHIENERIPGGRKAAKGIFTWQNGDTLPENIIRRMRDDQ